MNTALRTSARWTDEEHELLAKMAANRPRLSLTRMAEEVTALGFGIRTAGAIDNKMKELGLRGNAPKKPWRATGASTPRPIVDTPLLDAIECDRRFQEALRLAISRGAERMPSPPPDPGDRYIPMVFGVADPRSSYGSPGAMCAAVGSKGD